MFETVKPGSKRLEIRDASFAGFSLRVTESGRKTFGYAYRWGLEQRREGLGTYPATSLARAREKAVAIQRLVEEGIDPTAKRRATIVTVEDAVADFIRSYAKPRNKSLREAERTLTRELTGAYATRDILLRWEAQGIFSRRFRLGQSVFWSQAAIADHLARLAEEAGR